MWFGLVINRGYIRLGPNVKLIQMVFPVLSSNHLKP